MSTPRAGRLLTPVEAAARAGCSLEQLEALITSGDVLAYETEAGERFITQASLDSWSAVDQARMTGEIARSSRASAPGAYQDAIDLAIQYVTQRNQAEVTLRTIGAEAAAAEAAGNHQLAAVARELVRSLPKCKSEWDAEAGAWVLTVPGVGRVHTKPEGA